MNPLLKVSALSALLLSVSNPLSAQILSSYHVIDLGALGVPGGGPGPGWSFASGINNSGVVVGSSSWFNPAFQPGNHPFIWRPPSGPMQDLGSLAFGAAYQMGYSDFQGDDAVAINSSGTVVGGISITSSPPTDARFDGVYGGGKWQGAVKLFMGVVANNIANNTYATAINSTGTIVGTGMNYSDTFTALGRTNPVVLSGGTSTFSFPPVTILPDLHGILSGAYGINDSGVIVGRDMEYNAALPGVTAPMHALKWVGGVMTDMGYGAAYAINNNGVIVGGDGGGAGTTSFNTQPVMWVGGVKTPLDPGGNFGAAFALNNNAIPTIVGSGAGGAFVYYNGTFAHITPLLDAASSGWSISQANGINDSGQIVGVGQNGGLGIIQHAILLSPGVAGPPIVSGSITTPSTAPLGTVVPIAWSLSVN